MKYIYRNRKGKTIFTPLYKKYTDLFFQEILAETTIRHTFESFEPTNLVERYLLNAAQFSAAKNDAEVKLMQQQVFNEKGVLKGYQQFRQDVEPIAQVQQETWLRVEYETARRQAGAIEQFTRMQKDADLYPYWIYKGVMDSRERPEHVEMEDRVFQIGDADSDSCFPPLDWNCRCKGEPIDGMFVEENGLKVSTPADAKQYLEDNVDPQFRFNPAVQGAMPNDHSYFQGFPSANEGDAGTFGLPSAKDLGGDKELTGLAAKPFHQLVETIHGWKSLYHNDHRGNIVFQNKETLANVRLGDGAIHTIQKHQRGFENIPRCIEKPTEIWGKWENVGTQKVVLRAYLLIGRTSYAVLTRDGHITDAFAFSNGSENKLRNGLIIGGNE